MATAVCSLIEGGSDTPDLISICQSIIPEINTIPPSTADAYIFQSKSLNFSSISACFLM